VRPPYLSVALALAATAVAAAWALPASLARQLGLDVWAVSALQRQMDDDSRQAADLEARDAVVLARMALRDEVVSRLLAGRTDLRTAAAVFRRLNEQGGVREMTRLSFPGRTDLETAARQVLAWVRSTTQATEFPDGDKVVERLERELEALTCELENAPAVPPG
jgi:hypothetical protein